MTKSGLRHSRKIRRRWRAVMKHGLKAKPKHKLKAGRTGRMHAKKLQSRRG